MRDIANSKLKFSASSIEFIIIENAFLFKKDNIFNLFNFLN